MKLKQIAAVSLLAISLIANADCGDMVTNLLPNNTSASAFAGSSNGNLAATNISKVNVHSLLYAGNTTKVLAHYTPWWTSYPRGVNVGYISDSPTQALATFTDMNSRGVDGIILDWYGKGNYINQTMLDSLSSLAKFPNMTFSIMFDSGIQGVNGDPCSGCNVTQTIIAQLDYVKATYFTNPQYTKIGNQFLVTEFAMEIWSPAADWVAIQAAHPEVYWVHKDIAGFNRVDSQGSFNWVEAPAASTNPTTANLTAQVQFNQYAVGTGKTVIGGVWKGFDNSKASWADPVALLPQVCGSTWLQTFANANATFSTTHQLPFLQLVTWNDYEEGTALEPGITSCSTISTSVSSNTISISTAHPETIDHYELYAQSGSSYTYEGDIPVTQSSVIVNPTATYYIKGIGKPFMQNVISAAVTVK